MNFIRNPYPNHAHTTTIADLILFRKMRTNTCIWIWLLLYHLQLNSMILNIKQGFVSNMMTWEENFVRVLITYKIEFVTTLKRHRREFVF